MNFTEIFKEYYTIYRGQATNIPVTGDREYDMAIQLANSAIRKWDRADGVEWKELWTTAVVDGTADSQTVASTTEYSAPRNMRKQPGFIQIGTQRIKVVSPAQAEALGGPGNTYAYFTGSANTGYTLHFDPGDTSGETIDYTYLKKPRLITAGKDKPDMSDPNFMIQEMLATRFLNNRNGFGYKIAKNEANLALQNMKIENNSGTQGNSSNLNATGNWGIGRNNARLI